MTKSTRSPNPAWPRSLGSSPDLGQNLGVGGLWDHFIVAKTDVADLGMPSIESLGAHDGWRYVRVPYDVGTDAAVEDVARLLAVYRALSAEGASAARTIRSCSRRCAVG